jgi:hypothetical protein
LNIFNEFDSFFIIGPHDRFFEQENNFEFFTTNIDPQSVAGPIRRRVSSLFGETKTEGRYYEPQKITDDTLMDVCIHFFSKLINLFFSFFRMNIMIH